MKKKKQKKHYLHIQYWEACKLEKQHWFGGFSLHTSRKTKRTFQKAIKKRQTDYLSFRDTYLVPRGFSRKILVDEDTYNAVAGVDNGLHFEGIAPPSLSHTKPWRLPTLHP